MEKQDYIYINATFNKRWFIDGKEFNTAGSAGCYLRSLNFTFNETVDYLRVLPLVIK